MLSKQNKSSSAKVCGGRGSEITLYCSLTKSLLLAARTDCQLIGLHFKFRSKADTAEVSGTQQLHFALGRSNRCFYWQSQRGKVYRLGGKYKLSAQGSYAGNQARDFGLSCTGLTLLKALLGHEAFSRSRGGVLHGSRFTTGNSASSAFARVTSMAFACFETPFACCTDIHLLQ